ncbi:restriction endonuclease [Citrobacter freundii]|uniref:restriction endonuclease n=1 Tax=Citrobacter freundii TaxID=546 RepID=UPI002DBB82F8|nr:restriction endonuclease [Citrobacter freundii]MEB6429233.1 restriction endonuclease [Citrobacter freundii]
MKIEVACKPKATTKAKGDLLEKLAKRLLEAQNYEVTEEIRIVGAELDLLCTHKVSGKQIYVECKAYKDPISAPVLRQLWGTVDSEEYDEGWLISTAELTKDAKGFIENWKKKSKEKAARLSFYDPKVVIKSLENASIITYPPKHKAQELVGKNELLGEWCLLLCEYGMYWCVYTLRGGAPYGVLVFNAENGVHIQDEDTLNNLSLLEATISTFDLHIGLAQPKMPDIAPLTKLPTVVEVQTGDSWDDYRPARPKDFVGRDSTQQAIFHQLYSAKSSSTTKIFAITGNSGLGKSSLIAKLRDKSRNIRNKRKLFVYADLLPVD